MEKLPSHVKIMINLYIEDVKTYKYPSIRRCWFCDYKCHDFVCICEDCKSKLKNKKLKNKNNLQKQK